MNLWGPRGLRVFRGTGALGALETSGASGALEDLGP